MQLLPATSCPHSRHVSDHATCPHRSSPATWWSKKALAPAFAGLSSHRSVKLLSSRRERLHIAATDAPLRSVVVTGASSGIGRAAALDLAQRGWHVFAGVRKATDAAALQAAEPRITTLMLDVLDESSVTAAAEEVAEVVGDRGLHGVVNCAGIALITPLELIPIDDFAHVFEVNVTGTLRVTQQFLPLIRAAQGRIVNIGSQAGTLAFPGFGAYNCSKFALEGLSDTLRMEMVQFGVDVCHISPGAVKTTIWETGNANSNAVMEKTASHEASDKYSTLFSQCITAAAKAESKGCSTDETSAAVIDALEAYKPRTRYIVGKSARFNIPLRKFLPDRIFDMLVLGTLKKM